MLKNNDLIDSDPTFWLNRRVLVTGHTGLLGSWIASWLSDRGADVTGFARRPPGQASVLALAGLTVRVANITGDVRDRARVEQTMRAAAPEIVLHLAGRRCLAAARKRPLDSFDSNATGTLNILHAAGNAPGLRAVLVVATDLPSATSTCAFPAASAGSWTAVAAEPLTASLACAEIIAETFRQCYLQPADGVGLAVLRLPELVGGGDFATGRLVPDLVRSRAAGREPSLAAAVRAHPILHVLDAVACCEALARGLVQRPTACARSWSRGFGPPEPGSPEPWTRAAIADHVARCLDGRRTAIASAVAATPPAAAAARGPDSFDWRPRLGVATALDWALDGYRRLEAHGDAGFLADQCRRYAALKGPGPAAEDLLLPQPTPPAKASHVPLHA